MKKTHWLRTTLITLVACGIIGLIAAVVIFNADPGRTGAASTIEFSFDGNLTLEEFVAVWHAVKYAW